MCNCPDRSTDYCKAHGPVQGAKPETKPSSANAPAVVQRHPHKWAKEIKAWADGKTIEWKGPSKWIDVGEMPSWNHLNEYRIKPEPPSFGDVARVAWYTSHNKWVEGTDVQFASPTRWEAAAKAVIDAYKASENA